MKIVIIIGVAILFVIGFLIYMKLKKKDSPELRALKKEVKEADVATLKAIKQEKKMAAKQAKVAKKAEAVRQATAITHDARTQKMSRLIKKKD